ncbi:hypothetical protein N7471_010657 [Penicillium samsonianum]|uniref:uncharacterized protein n=1 Tax=Penicillium samsonianum TaxID=1882272 RepID=UPI002549BFCF|nr:uncharacterized protein N7471_010657 [Penicillium samsonianum]KAJ6126164.1 hypothetical protein N7471_010657 [Penicillium samsonianum]
MSLAPLSPADQDVENLSPVDQDFENLFYIGQPTEEDLNAILKHFDDTPDIKIPPKPYNTALEAASHIDHGADLQFRKKCDREYRSPLDVAWKEGSKEVATELLKRLEDPQYRGTEVHRALCIASEVGNKAQVEALLQKVTDVNYQDDAYGPALGEYAALPLRKPSDSRY